MNCRCGCGKSTKLGNIYIHGHSTVIPRPPMRYGEVEGENVAFIPLACGREAIVDAIHAEKVGGLHWHFHGGYARNWRMFMHTFLFSSVPHPDHRNGNGLDNRSSNIRPATQQQNNRNRRMLKKNSSGYKGVYPKGRRFQARIMVNYKSINLGYFATPEEAFAAYSEGAKKYHGEFARTA